MAGFAIMLATIFMPKQAEAKGNLIIPKAHYGKAIGLGMAAIVLLGIDFSFFNKSTPKEYKVVVPQEMSEDTLKELLSDPGVQEFILEDEKSE